MSVKELIDKLSKMNPDAIVLLRDHFDDAEGEVDYVDSDPSATPETTEMVMIWGDFN